jgi:hypothetical protein
MNNFHFPLCPCTAGMPLEEKQLLENGFLAYRDDLPLGV